MRKGCFEETVLEGFHWPCKHFGKLIKGYEPCASCSVMDDNSTNYNWEPPEINIHTTILKPVERG